MKALVTGGAGFIGSNVVRKLLSEGADVRIIDDLSSGYRSNIEGLDVDFVEADILDAEAVKKAMQGRDTVFHLAASVGRQRSLDDPQKDSMVNLIGTVNVLEAMRHEGARRIVYSSSAAIFGEPENEVMSEDHPQNADSPYGVSKLAAEKMILAYGGIYDITGVCLRYFNIFGRGQKYDYYGNVIPKFAQLLHEGKSLTIYGDGTQTRDFLDVKDVAEANYAAAVADTKSDVINLGTGTSVTIKELADRMQEMSGKKTGITYEPPRPADPKHSKADTEKMKKILQINPEFTWQSVGEYMKWFEEDNAIN
jgi:nucleoside-diphosphate-sugar epimerase